VRRSRSFRTGGGVLGLNIGKNADTPIDRAAQDYLLGLEGVFQHADYVTVNVSSPNTRDLRSLQGDGALDALLSALVTRRDALARAQRRQVPLMLKVAPDLDESQLRSIATTVKRHGIDGVIATNTTVARHAVRSLPHADEAGGLSGAPVFEPSNRAIRVLRAELGRDVPIIGVGGVLSGADACAKLEAGADLVQIYTGLIYKGPALVDQCARAMQARRATR
jgi:dihydroorotate dehydrogenase